MTELQKAAKEAHIPILGTHLTSSRVLGNMTSYLVSRLAPRKSVHGVLVDINGVGVLITGDSGVPVRTGRNLAIIIESAAMNYRANTMGYDATETFGENLSRLIKQNTARDKARREMPKNDQ